MKKEMKNKKQPVVYSQGGVDVYYYNYKEPFIKFEGGFGFLGALAYSKDQEKIQCHFCGGFFKAIRGSHIDVCEGIKDYEMRFKVAVDNLTDYKRITGLNASTVMVGEATRKILVENSMTKSRKLVRSNWNDQVEMMKRRERLIKINRARKGSKIQMETRNKNGTCPIQLLDRINHVKKEIGRTPSKRDFYNFYKGKYLGAIYQTYGSYIEAVKQAGHTPQSELYKGNFQYTDEQLIEFLQKFVEINGRLATSSDHERGLLPAYSTYITRFGSINKARELAGLPTTFKKDSFRYELDYSTCSDQYLKYFNK